MRTFIGPDIILSDLTEGPTLFAQSVIYVNRTISSAFIIITLDDHMHKNYKSMNIDTLKIIYENISSFKSSPTTLIAKTHIIFECICI